MGNVHPSFCWREILADDPHVDLVVRGEGEATFADLVAALAGRRAGSTGSPALAHRLDGLPVSNPRGRSAPTSTRSSPPGT